MATALSHALRAVAKVSGLCIATGARESKGPPTDLTGEVEIVWVLKLNGLGAEPGPASAARLPSSDMAAGYANCKPGRCIIPLYDGARCASVFREVTAGAVRRRWEGARKDSSVVSMPVLV